MPAGMAVLRQRDGRWLCEECVTVNDPLESWCFVCGLLKTGAEDDGNSSIVSPIRMLVRQLNYATQALGDPATAEQKKTTLKRLVDALATFSRSAEEEMQTSDDDKVVNPSNLRGLAEAVRGRKGGIIDEKLAGATDKASAKMAGALDACGKEVNWQGKIGEKGRLAVGFAIDVAHVAKMKEETCFQNLRYTKLITARARLTIIPERSVSVIRAFIRLSSSIGSTRWSSKASLFQSFQKRTLRRDQAGNVDVAAS